MIDLETFDFSKVKITFFAAGGKISENFAEIAAKHSLVIDNSSFYRMDPDVPLIVPQVNSDHLNNIKKNIIANPNYTVSFLAFNTPEIFEAHYSVPMTGGVLNTINVRLDANTIAYILDHSEAKVLVVDRQLHVEVKKALQKINKKKLLSLT